MKGTRILVSLTLLAGLIATAAIAEEPTLGWSILHDGGAALTDENVVVLLDADGNVITGGIHDTGTDYTDLLVRKLDAVDGTPIWTFTYADPMGNDMALTDLVLDHRGDVLIAGYLSACDS